MELLADSQPVSERPRRSTCAAAADIGDRILPYGASDAICIDSDANTGAVSSINAAMSGTCAAAPRLPSPPLRAPRRRGTYHLPPFYRG